MTAFADDLAEVGLTEDDVNRALQENLKAGLVAGTQDADVRSSPIHGNGAFTTVDRRVGRLALVVRGDYRMTEAGAAVNHSRTANCGLVHTPGGNMYLQALRDIDAGEELTHDYRVAKWSPSV